MILKDFFPGQANEKNQGNQLKSEHCGQVSEDSRLRNDGLEGNQFSGLSKEDGRVINEESEKGLNNAENVGCPVKFG